MKSSAYKLYLSVKKKLNFWIDRYTEFAYLFLSGYYELPWLAAQRLGKKVVSKLGDFLFFLKDFPRLTVTRMIGPDWTMMYVGSDESPGKENRRKFSGFFFPNGVRMEPAGRVNIWHLQREIDRWLAQGAGLVVCEISRFRPVRLRAQVHFQIPIWVHQVFRIPQPVDELLTGKNAKALRLAKRAMKAGYSCRLSRSDEEFDFFYHRMYIPYLTQRHNNQALLTPFENLKKFFQKGGLILVEKDDRPKAGAVGYVGAGEYLSVAGGILDADPELFKDGVHVYNTYCEAHFASQQGARTYDMGASFSLRTSGVFHHKTLWGARAQPRKRILPDWIFLADQIPAALCQYLNDLRLITEISGRYYGLALVVRHEDLLPENTQSDLQSAQRDGLSGVAYVFTDGKIQVKE